MSDPQTDALINLLRRSNRRWKAIALGTITLLVLAVAGLATLSAVQASRAWAAAEDARMAAEKARLQAEQAVREALQEAERALQAEKGAWQQADKALQQAEEAKKDTKRLLYLETIRLAERALDQAGRGGEKP
jgi:hypothetical protein